MKTLWESPLIFAGNPDIEPLSVRLRVALHDAFCEIEKFGDEIETAADLVGDAKKIRHGIAVLGPEVEDGVPVIPISAITDNHNIDFDKLRLVDNDVAEAHPHTKLHGGEVIISVKGTLGKTAIVPHELAGGNITREVAVFPVAEAVDAKFLLLVLNSKIGRSQMTVRSFGEVVAESIVGSAITLPELRELKIPKFTRKEKEIALERFREIESYSFLIKKKALNKKALRERHLDSILDVIAKEIGITKFPTPWFGRLYLQPTTANVDRLDVLGANTKFEDDCIQCGGFVPLSEVCNVSGSNEQIPLGVQKYISIESLPGNYWGEIDIPEIEIDKQTGRTHFFAGDIAWAHLKPSILQGKVFITRDECWGSHHFLKISTSKVNDDIRTIIWAYLKTSPIKRHLANKCTGKSESQKDISDKALSALPFPKLNDNQIKKVANSIRDIIESSHAFESQENDLNKMAEGLLEKACSNIRDLLDEDHFKTLLAEAKEALQ
jgi:hypothetical protein